MGRERRRARQRAAGTTPHKPASQVNQTSTGQMEQLGAEKLPPSETPSTSTTASTSSSQSPPVSLSSPPPRDDAEMKARVDPQHRVQAAQSTDAEHSNDADAPATVQRISPITLEAIEAAIREMERHMQGAVAAEEDGELGHFPYVIIATDVTQDDLDQVPADWLDDVEVELRPDGVLVAVCVASSQQEFVNVELVRQVARYARENNLEGGSFPTEKLAGKVPSPTFWVATRPTAGGTSTMRVVFAGDVNKRSGTDIITIVAKWFTLFPFLQRVVYVKCFPPRKTTDGVLAAIPAIGMVFRRGESRMVYYDSRQCRHFNLWRVHIEDSQSFGNGEINRLALSPFLATTPHVLLENPSDDVPDHTLDASPLFPATIPRNAFAQDMDRILEEAREAARARTDPGDIQAEIAQVLAGRAGDHAALSIEVESSLPPIQLDLIMLFWNALQGHIFDSTRDHMADLVDPEAATEMGDGTEVEVAEIDSEMGDAEADDAMGGAEVDDTVEGAQVDVAMGDTQWPTGDRSWPVGFGLETINALLGTDPDNATEVTEMAVGDA